LLEFKQEMPLFTKTELRTAAEAGRARLQKAVKSLSLRDDYDIFLSHRYDDKDYVDGLYEILENMGYTCFVDWKQEPGLNRSTVDREVADWIRQAIARSKCLLYAFTQGSQDSRWMQWELGYGDAKNGGKVAILPIANFQVTEHYRGQEYLGLYPYVTKTLVANHSREEIWINEAWNNYVSLSGWLHGAQPQLREH
jgi:hypothetical protein